MSQLVRTTNDLIISALYLTGELGVAENPDNFMLTTGLELINELFDKFSNSGIYIPYLTTVEFDFVTGQGSYTISDMIVDPDVESNRIVDIYQAYYVVPDGDDDNSNLYQMTEVTEQQLYANMTQTSFASLPSVYVLKQEANKSIITVYPQPSSDYTCTLRCKLMLDSVIAFSDLSGVPPYYYGFLKYSLARKFLAYYPSANWSAASEQEYQDYYEAIKGSNPTDMTIQPSGILGSAQRFYVPNLVVT